nr:hypothetical protein [uncultured Allomuricauda sp.]
MKTPLSLAIVFTLIFNLSAQESRTLEIPKEFNLMSNLQLEQTGFQFLMSSQNYDSNYGIYVKLYTSNVNGDSNKRRLDRADFKLINYKTKVFLSIVHVALQKVDTGNIRLEELQRSIRGLKLSDIEDYKFKVFVQAKSHDTSCIKTLVPNTEIVLNKKKVLLSERYLVPMFAEKIQEEPSDDPSECWLFESEELGLFRIKPHNFFIVDTEFFFMDGLGNIVRKKDYEDYAIDAYSEKDFKLAQDDGKSMPGLRCKTGMNIMF